MAEAAVKQPEVKPKATETSPGEGLVQIADYEKLMEDRPRKFTAGQVGFEPRARQQRYRCDACAHWYTSPVAKRSVCEIYAPDDERRHVPPEASCRFWTADGEEFPRLAERVDKNKPDAVPPNKRHTVG